MVLEVPWLVRLSLLFFFLLLKLLPRTLLTKPCNDLLLLFDDDVLMTETGDTKSFGFEALIPDVDVTATILAEPESV